MNKALLVEYDPFSMESRVSIFEDNVKDYVKVSSNLEDLTSNLVAIAYDTNIYSIKIHGPFAIANELDRMIRQYELNNYSENKITIEGF